MQRGRISSLKFPFSSARSSSVYRETVHRDTVTISDTTASSGSQKYFWFTLASYCCLLLSECLNPLWSFGSPKLRTHTKRLLQPRCCPVFLYEMFQNISVRSASTAAATVNTVTAKVAAQAQQQPQKQQQQQHDGVRTVSETVF